MIIGLVGTVGAGKDTAGAAIASELNGVCIAFADPIKRWCMNALNLTERQLWGDQKEKPISKAQLKALEPKGKAKLMFDCPTPTPLMDALAEACGSVAQRERVADRLWTTSEWYVNADTESAAHAWWNELKKEKGLTPRRVMQHFGTDFVRRKMHQDFWVKTGFEIAGQVLLGHDYDRVQGLAAMHGGKNVAVITDVRFRNEVMAIKRAGGLVYRIERAGGSRTKLSTHASETEQSSVPQFWLDGTIINRYETAEEFQETVRRVVARELIGARGGAVN